MCMHMCMHMCSACMCMWSACTPPPLCTPLQVLLQRAGLPERYHRRAISDGMLLAILLRIAAMCFGAALLQRFSWLKVVLGTVLLFNGLRALALAAVAPDEDAAPPPSPRSH